MVEEKNNDRIYYPIKKSQLTDILNDSYTGLLLIKTDTCPSCRQLEMYINKKTLELVRILNEHNLRLTILNFIFFPQDDAKFKDYNMLLESIIKKNDVVVFPTTLALRNGKEIDRFRGFYGRNYNKLKSFITYNYQS